MNIKGQERPGIILPVEIVPPAYYSRLEQEGDAETDGIYRKKGGGGDFFFFFMVNTRGYKDRISINKLFLYILQVIIFF